MYTQTNSSGFLLAMLPHNMSLQLLHTVIGVAAGEAAEFAFLPLSRAQELVLGEYRPVEEYAARGAPQLVLWFRKLF